MFEEQKNLKIKELEIFKDLNLNLRLKIKFNNF